MRDLPIIKVELKRNIWVLWVALLLEFFLCCGSTLRQFRFVTRVFARHLDYTFYYNEGFTAALWCCLIWIPLLVFLQFNNDSIDFKQALPYTKRTLLFGKFITFIAALIPFAVVYVLIIGSSMREYDFVQSAKYWWFPDGSMKNAELWINSLAVLSFAFALYGYVLVCSSMCRNAVLGVMLAGYGMAAFDTLAKFCDRQSTFFSNLSTEFTWEVTEAFGGMSYVLPEITVAAVCIILSLILIPTAFLLYGGGSSRHLFFRYRAAEILSVIITVVLFACLVPMITGINAIGIVVGAVLGLVIALSANYFLKRGTEV